MALPREARTNVSRSYLLGATSAAALTADYPLNGLNYSHKSGPWRVLPPQVSGQPFLLNM